MKNNSRNRGFSLIELIVVISIMAVLAGLLIPQFMKYATNKRQMACRTNREALLNIYEKAVYDGQLGLETADIQMVTGASGSKMTTEYINQARDYLECPSADGFVQYKGYVDDGKAYIVCDCHPDDVCSIELVGWASRIPDEMDGEPTYTIPGGGEPGEPGGTPDAPEEPGSIDTSETCNTGIWPRPMDSEGRIDARWVSAGGAKAGNFVMINAPLHFIDESGAEIVIVCGNDGSGKYKVSYENAQSPIGKGMGALQYVIATSGRNYNIDAGSEPPKITIKKETKRELVKKAYTETKIITTAERAALPKNEQNKYKEEQLKPDKYDKLQADEKKTYTPHYKKNGDKKPDYYNRYVQIINHPDEYKDVIIPAHDEYEVGYGDMVTVNGITYIYTKNDGVRAQLPTNDATAYSTDYDGWYRVPSLTTE